MLESAFYYFPPLLELALFFELGGPVLILISIVGLIMWVLVFERFVFLLTVSANLRHSVIHRWKSIESPSSWTAHQLKNCWLSEYSQQLNSHLILIRTCIAVSPLLGLLGTVTGMIEVFDVMSSSGLGDTRAMADGISKATIPTMAGMVISLSGYMVITFIQQKITSDKQALYEQLSY